MKKASEYRKHAEECRLLAQKMDPGDQRNQLLDMAKTWGDLANDRADLIRRHPEMALSGEHAEEAKAKQPK
jgi:hypothetical protein